jgi:hypothetical protein
VYREAGLFLEQLVCSKSSSYVYRATDLKLEYWSVYRATDLKLELLVCV